MGKEAEETTEEAEEIEEITGYENMLHPSVENLIEEAGSKFLLVTLSAQRTNDINTYYQGLGSGMAGVAPPQVGGDYASYLSVSFEEISEKKTVLNRTPPPPIAMEELPTASTTQEVSQEQASTKAPTEKS